MKLRDATKQREKLRDMSMDQLTDELAKLKREAFNLRFQKATGQLENTVRIGEVRRSVARLKTVIGEKRRAKV